jgi:hypothetical protein
LGSHLQAPDPDQSEADVNGNSYSTVSLCHSLAEKKRKKIMVLKIKMPPHVMDTPEV